MKLRIKGNSIRMRLGQSEVRRLASEGVIAEFTDFGAFSPEHFGYALHVTFEDPTISARFADGRVIVRVPAGAIRLWAETEQSDIRAVQRTTDGSELRILIEKDLECIEVPADESQEDAFPNPLSACAASGSD
jgi:hypothetical protein